MSRRCVRLLVTGQVQGVSYRWSAQRYAQHLGLTGWVRNLDGGEVEATAEGEAAVVEQFIAWCRQGPPAAEVERVEVTEQPVAEGLPRFEIRH
jgi:acylphosphatase